MSQSPIDDFSPRATMRYQQGWKALNRLLHEDRSFSGHERNCVFLNMPTTDGSPAFADVSAASGLDFADDARAVAAVDWDFDGDLDLWITNRTAPRLRLLRNGNPSGNRFLAVRLQGDGRRTNRDAVGARVELHLAGGPRNMLIKTLHAGDGFLSQSSNWLHFGLGDETEIQRLVVHWPGGERQQYTGLAVDGRHVIDQSTGKVTAWQPPSDRVALVASEPELPTPTDQARIVAPARLLLPPIATADGEGTLNSRLHGPTLINLWSTTCNSCLEELAEWSRESARLKASGLDVVAVNLDNLDGDSAAADKVLKRLKFSFRSYYGTADLVEILDIFQQTLLDRWQPLPVPVSFLIDRHGQVAAVYKGRVAIERLLADVKLLDADAAALRDQGTPFAGRWINEPPDADPLRVASQLIDNARVDDAMAYLQQYAERAASAASGTDKSAAGDIFYVLAVLLRDQRQDDEAREAFRRALEYSPDDYRVRNDLADLLAQRGQLAAAAEQLLHALRIKPADVAVQRKLGLVKLGQRDMPAAIELFSQVVEAEPNDVASRYNLANAYRAAGNIRTAVEHYRETLRLQPRMTPAANNLAWILATHPDASLRDGQEAVRLAEAACRQTGNRQPGFLDTLAAAYAETGAFDQAVDTCQQAVSSLVEAGKPEQARDLERRLALYRQQMPYRDAPSEK